jgi:hypothetical protein
VVKALAFARDDVEQPGLDVEDRLSGLPEVVPCSIGLSFAASREDERRASATELAAARRLGTRSGRFAVVVPAEQDGEDEADVALAQGPTQQRADRYARSLSRQSSRFG